MSVKRPVSLISQICKLLETIIRDNMMDFLVKHKLINISQHGFLKARSCLTNLLCFFEEITKWVDDGSPVDVIYLDFQKAFDKVPHQRLILKLKSHGMGNCIINWIEQWLTDRSQRVVVDGEVSSWKSVLRGVPQGSVLGPILFLVYINDLEEGVTGKSKFADDTKLFTKTKEIGDKQNLQDDIDKLVKWSEKWQMLFNFGKCKCLHIGPGNTSMTYEMGGTILSTTEKAALTRIQACVREIKAWLNHNRLHLNDNKTEVLVITTPSSANKHSVTDVIVGDSIIRPTAVARNIGVMFDNELSLKSQVSKLCQVAFFYIRRIRSIRDCLTQHATELLIHSLVISRLDYGNGLLYGVSDKLLDKLQRVQNVAARVVVKASRYDHITPILKTLHWLPIRYRTEYKLLLLTFKAPHHLAPSYLTDLLQLYHPTRTLRSSSDALLTEHSARLRNYGDRAFCVAAPKLWNNLPLNIRECGSVNSFKRLLKTHLFKRAFNI